MASNEVEALDPATTVEKEKNIPSELAVDRRHLMAALGVAGAVAGAGLLTMGRSTLAQQPTPSGFQPIDVLNFLLNIKYLKATFYSFLLTGADIPSTVVTTNGLPVTDGTGGLFNQFSKLTFTGLINNTQANDLFFAMYYDEVNQLVALRNLVYSLGTNPTSRQTMNLLGTGTTTTATVAPSVNTSLGLARMLEDVSLQAFIGAGQYFTGAGLANELAYVNQVLATNGFHAGALRLLCIQNNIPYLSTSYLNTVGTTQTQNTLSPTLLAGSTTAYMSPPATTNPAVVGNAISGVGIPVGTVITAASTPPIYTGSLSGSTLAPSNVITNLSTTQGLFIGQTVTGTGIPATASISSITPASSSTAGSITLNFVVAPPANPGSAPGFALNGSLVNGTGSAIGGAYAAGIVTTANNVAFTVGFLALATKSSTVLTSVSTTAGLAIGQPLTGTNVSGYITAIGTNTVTMSAAASGSSTVAPTGLLTTGSPLITSVSSVSGLAVGQTITGTGVAPGATISSFDPGITTLGPTITMSANATATTITNGPVTITLTALLTSGSNLVTSSSTISGLAAGQKITGTGIPSNTFIGSVGGTNTFTLTNSSGTAPVAATASTTGTTPITATGILVAGANSITAVSGITGLKAGQSIVSPAGGLPPGTTITAVSGTTITLSANATANSPLASPITITGTVTAGSPYITNLSSTAGLATSTQTLTWIVTGQYVPANSYIKTLDTVNMIITLPAAVATSGGVSVDVVTLTIYQAQTLIATTNPTLTITGSAATATPTTLTVPSLQVVTPGLASITLSQPATTTGATTVTQTTADALDVVPADPGANVFGGTLTSGSITVTAVTTTSTSAVAIGQTIVGIGIPANTTIVALTPATSNAALGTLTLSAAATASGAGTVLTAYLPNAAALAARGPSAVAGAAGPVYQGFFETAGATTGTVNTPAGTVFPRTFSQALAALYGSTISGTYEGGFYPAGIAGGAAQGSLNSV